MWGNLKKSTEVTYVVSLRFPGPKAEINRFWSSLLRLCFPCVTVFFQSKNLRKRVARCWETWRLNRNDWSQRLVTIKSKDFSENWICHSFTLEYEVLQWIRCFDI
jgi:hypothetical protein